MCKGAASNRDLVWIASYPRSGNTFLRTILWQCFGLRSASVYRNDLGGNSDLEKCVGHIEHGHDGRIPFTENTMNLLKTHGHPVDRNPAIYVIRDGRAAAVSLWKFDGGNTPLATIIEGHHRFGAWSDHVRAWDPANRPDTLLLEYEDMKNDLLATLEKIGFFLDKDILSTRIPRRASIAGIDGRWVKSSSDWKAGIPGEFIERFNQLNEEMLKKMGYL